MGARLSYAKVIDQAEFLARGGKLHPGLPNFVLVRDEPGAAATFLVMRGWVDDHGTFTEQWRIDTPGGSRVYESLPREIHLPTTEHIERLEDEVSGLELEYAADDYSVVFLLDDREVARVQFSARNQAVAQDGG